MPTRILPYVLLDDAKAAIEEYQEVFGLEVISRIPFSPEMGGMPKGFDYENSTMHASVKIGDAEFYVSDNMMAAADGGKVTMMLEPASLKQMKAIFNKAKEKGYKIHQELEKMFWGDYFTLFEDRFGILWQMNLSGQ